MYSLAGKSLLMCSYAMVNYERNKGGGLKIKFKKVLESII